MLCAKCNYDNPADALFCMKCGSKVENRCSSCNTVNPADAKFCRKCGEALGTDAPASSPSPDIAAKTSRVEVTHERQTAEGLEGERKTVTALFADIKGSTELERDLDPEDARAIVDPVLHLMMAAVHRYDGYVAQSTGDGIFALFGAPVAHEDHAQRALLAALAMQRELRQYGERLKSQGQSPVEVRIGINTGEVVMRTIQTGGHPEYTPVGHVTNLAARMQTVAAAGGIVISEDTRRLVEGYFELRAMGPTVVKGVNAPVKVYEVLGAGPLRGHFELAARRGLTTFIGRERELGELRRALELAMSGHGQVVAVVAEAGTGKSRLVYEFKTTLPSDCRVLEAYSVSHGKASAWLPVLELLHNYFGIEGVDDPPTRRRKLSARLATLDLTLSDTLPYLFGLLGIQESPDPLAHMDPQVRRRRTLDALKRIMLGESLEHPVAVIFEDLHWIDSETQALLDLLADSIANSRLLLLVNYRPEYRHEWANKSYYSQLRLDALGGESAGAMLAALLGDAVELAPLKRLIVERTGGNPFFIEEMVQALFDEGTLMRNGAVKVTSSLSQLRLPPTVQGILASRIDRLSAEQKELLQTLAVIGRESPLGLIRKVAAITEEQLKRMLSDLRAAEFIYEQPALTEAEYVFKHALTQEVAYNSLLRERRKQIHERAAQAIEALFALNLSDQYSELAHHYGRSGNGSKAVKYLRLAAEQAMSRSAYMEARDRLNSAVELLRAQPDEPERDRTEISLRFSLNICMKFSGGLGTAASVENMERARQLCEMIGDDISLFEALNALEDQYFQSAENQKIQAVGEELVKIATRTNNSEMLGRALFWLGAFSGMRGEFTAAAEALEQARSLSAGGWSTRDAQGFYDWRIETRTYAAPVWWTLGFPERAMARSAESFEVARAIAASPSVLMIALSFSSFLNLRCRDWKMALSHIDEAKRLADEYGMIDPTGFFRGWAVARLGQPEDGLAKMLPARGWMTALRRWRPLFFWGLADVYLAIGDARQGLEAVNHALEVSRGEFEAELRRVKGELLLIADEGAVAEATQCFRDAIELARRQSAKSWELRATTSLARLLAKQERRDEARTMLAEIYNWFTEGFDTADLKDAKALLDELSA